MKTFHCTFFILCLLIAPPAFAQEWQSSFLVDHPLVGTIYDAGGNQISKTELLKRLRKEDIILIGEKHDNPDHHQIEALLLAQLADENTTVVFEMLDSSYTNALRILPHNLNLDDLRDHLNWNHNSWSWEDYGPLLVQSLQQGAEIKAGNIDTVTMMAVYKNGLNDITQKNQFQSIVKTSEKLQNPLTELVFTSHCEKVVREKLQPMVDIQLARDASMAHAINTATRQNKILISGGVHANKVLGVPQHITRKTTTLLLREVGSNTLVINKPFTHADYIWFTPQFSDEDYCDKFNK